MQDLQQLESDLNEALKERDKIRLTTLRLLKSALQNYKIEVGHDLSTQEIVQVLQKEAKKHRDSIESYQKAGRDDLAKEESEELEILDSYLPQQISEEELTKVIDQVIAETGAKDKSQTGQVMGAVMARVSGQADGKRVSAIVAQKLS